MSTPKYERIVSRALELTRAGSKPDVAWLNVLSEVYSAQKLEDQVKHSCPKWAFCILCHRGYVRDVPANSCPNAERSNSAAFTLKALNLLSTEPSLVENKRELIERVFGRKGEPGYREPNNEVEVLLYLLNSRAIQIPGR